MTKYILVINDGEFEFDCDLDDTTKTSPNNPGPTDGKGDDGYMEFWDYHHPFTLINQSEWDHPGTNDTGMSKADEAKFNQLYEDGKIQCMEYVNPSTDHGEATLATLKYLKKKKEEA